MFQTRRLRVGNIMCAQNEAPGTIASFGWNTPSATQSGAGFASV